jgi:FixJ family two-component response regulator
VPGERDEVRRLRDDQRGRGPARHDAPQRGAEQHRAGDVAEHEQPDAQPEDAVRGEPGRGRLAEHAVIAARLGLSAKTVGNHTSAIFAKLQVADRAEAIVRAREAGLGGG